MLSSSILFSFILVSVFKHAEPAFATIKNVIKNKFEPSSSNFFTTSEVEHLDMIKGNEFSCFVKEKGEGCEYDQQKFKDKCTGCTVESGIFEFKNPGATVTITDGGITDGGITEIDGASLDSTETGVTALYIVNSINLVSIGSDIFEKFPNLEEITVYKTAITSTLNITKPLKKLRYMAILDNNVNRINDYDFTQMPNLEQLNLACNNISFISSKAFIGLHALTKITLGFNALSYFPGALSGVKETIKYIGLERNNINILPVLPLKDMNSLVHLNLTLNSITKIETGWTSGCPNLKFLDLGANRMEQLESFAISDLISLIYLDISSNSYLELLDGSSLKDLESLRIVDLYGNPQLSNIDYRTFDNLPKIKYMDLSRNNIANFPHSSFIYGNFDELTKLWMNSNSMDSIAEFSGESFNTITGILETRFEDVYSLSQSFNQMKKLTYLDLSDNDLTIIPDSVLDCFKTANQNSTLDLSNNKIVTIEDNAFYEMRLKDLDLHANFLSEVPKAMFNVKYLDNLDLSFNLLTYLEKGTLFNLNMTQKIYLNNNQILKIEDDALPRGLEYISIADNYFDFLDENQFNNMPNLCEIDFSNNRISYLPEDVFANNTNLQSITLNNNDIKWINKGVFTTCNDQISYLNMEENDLAYVEHGVLADKSILRVEMSNNKLHDWPQDGSFSSQSEDFYVDFSNNQFEVIKSGMFSYHKKFLKADFKNNIISDIEANAFSNLEINYLQAYDDIFGILLTSNPIANLEPYSFTNITSETKGKGLYNHAALDLQKIKTLYTLRSNTFYNITLDYIFLNNGQVETIETHAFYKIRLHWTLQFNEGPLKYVSKKAINADYIRYIQLNYNNIRKLPLGAFEEIAECQNFNINDNDINFIDTDSLPNCFDKFNFQSNKITYIIADAFRKATSITSLELQNNEIIKIEAGAFNTFITTLNKLYINGNPLPELPDDLLEGATMTNLELKDNDMLRTIGIQEDLSFSNANFPLIDVSQEAYIDASIYKEVKNGGSNVNIYGVSECTCNLLQAIKNIADKTRKITIKNPTKCSYNSAISGTFEQLQINDNSPNNGQGKIQCEPYVTKTVRTSLEFKDEIAISESITMYWKLPNVQIWGNSGIYCCEDTSNDCINEISLVMVCQSQTVDGNEADIFTTPEFKVSLSQQDSCDKEFSYTKEIDFSTSDFIFCSAKILIVITDETDSFYSAMGPWRVGHREAVKATPSLCSSVSQVLSLGATYFDLTNDFVDFQNMGKDTIYQTPKLYNSPNVGPYLYMTDYLSDEDTLTQWYTPNSNIQNILQEDFCLKQCSEFGDDAYCMFAREWWPVDSLVESPTDTTSNFARHNMYFTGRLRVPIKFGGNEILTIGGPDDVWVYMNGSLVLEVLAVEEDTANLPCGELSFGNDGAALVTKIGYLNMNQLLDEEYTTRCMDMNVTVNWVDPNIFLLNDNLYVDIFTTQRRSGTSQLFMRMSKFEKVEWSNFVVFAMSEVKIRDGKINQLDFDTVLGTQSYDIEIINTNSYFEVRNGDFGWVEDPSPHEANVNPGNDVPDHYNCSVNEEPIPDVTPSSTCTVDTTTALITLKNQIDYENIEPKYLFLYLNTTFKYDTLGDGRYLYTEIRVRIDIIDANDNCPQFNDSWHSLIDRTNLCLDLRGNQLNVTDNDNGNNSAIEFFIGAFEVVNLNASQYEEYRTVADYFTYEETMVQFLFEVYGIDEGSPVRLGGRNEYTLEVSASCIQDMELVIGTESGIFDVKAPGWMVSSGDLSFCDTCTLGYRCPGFGSRIQCSTCRQSFTNSELDGWMFDDIAREEAGCANRSKWEIAFGSQAECYDCKPGWECSGGVGTPVEQLERDQGFEEGTHFINLCTDEDEDCVQELQECEAGYLCRAGVTERCSTGQFSDAGSSGCSFCPPGQYAPQQGAVNCTCCEGGEESTHAKQSCDYCPENEVSDGCSMCRRCSSEVECPCNADTRPCSDGVQCVNLPDNAYKCLSCPEGYVDQDNSCVDIDECELYSPCFADLNVTCTNTVPGFKCDSCPSGYEGNSPEGIGKPEQNQTCTDINECETENGGCDLNSECINKAGYHYCGYCFGQWVGNGTAECESGDYCSRGLDRCDTNAICTTTGPAGYSCQCNIMYAGNGTACGIDSDGDGYPDTTQNCLGDMCKADNCVSLPNTDQADIDSDSLGDECDTDIDGDLIINGNDLCPYNMNISTEEAGQADNDDDGWLDDCDNCIDTSNYDQYDKDGDGVGDECEEQKDAAAFTDILVCSTEDNTGVDSDGDGVDDGCDNCPYVANSAQRDTDEDTIGDRCDDDIDDDTLSNTADNCPYLANTDQANKDRDFKGDLCDDSKSWPDTMVNDADADGDGVPDVDDICPYDSRTSVFSFTTSELIDFATLSTPSTVRWKVWSAGHDVDLEAIMYDTTNDGFDNPIALLGETRFEEVQFEGTFYVRDEEEVYPTQHNGAIGIIFGYQKLYQRSSSSRYITKFYLATWRNNYYTFNNCGSGRDDCNFGATTGLQIKAVAIDSTSSSSKRREALWWSASETNSAAGVTTRLIYQDPKHKAWEMNTAYRWRLQHHASTGLLQMTLHTVSEATVTVVVDTGYLFDKTVRGGRIGLFSHGQWNVTFANIAAKCLEAENLAARFAGASVISLGALSGLGITRSFQISLWFKLSAAPTTTSPLICKNRQTNTQTLCLSVTPGLQIEGEYASNTLITEQGITLNTWIHVILKYDMQFKIVTLFSNIAGYYGSLQTVGVDVGPASEIVYLGWDGDQYLTGTTIDEVRIINRHLNDTSYMHAVLLEPSLVRQNKMRLVGAHLNFDRGNIADVLGNIEISDLNTDTSLLPELVTSSILGQMYRFDEKGDLEDGMSAATLTRRKRRRIRETNKRGGELLVEGHDEL